MNVLQGFMDKKAVAQVLEQIAAFPRAQEREPVPGPRVPHRGAGRGRISGRPARGTRERRPRLDQGRRPGHAPDRRARSSPPAARACSRSCASRSRPGWSRCSPSRDSVSPRSGRSTRCSTSTPCPSSRRPRSDGRLARLPRFGQKTSENILKGIAFLRQASAFRLSHHAADEAEGLRAALERMPGVTSAVVAGDVRRRTEVVRDLVLVLVADTSPAEVFKRLSQLAGRARVRRAGRAPRDASVRRRSERADRRDGPRERRRRAGAGHRQRGPPARSSPSTRPAPGFAFNGAALWRGSEFVPTPDEATFYERLGLELIPPELREGQGEIDAAAAREPCPGCSSAATCGGFSTATRRTPTARTRSRSWREACQAAGYEYVGITDHSQAAAYAGGLQGRTTSRARPTRSTRPTPGCRASGCSRASRPTSFRTAASTSTSRCSRGSIS